MRTMNYYFAPMEGITLYPLRNIHREIFGKGVDKYFTPFLTAVHTHHFKNREKKDILPNKNTAFENYGDEIVPQIMTGCAEDFLWAAAEIKKLGYNEVNLNLGCPAPTVVNRRKGAGLLMDTDYLEEMLEKIFEVVPEAGDCDGENNNPYPYVSLKTRLGFSSPDEAERLMEVYAKFPIKELIIHARVRDDYYSGVPRLDGFEKALKVYREMGGRAAVCYNGNIDSVEDYKRICDALGMSSGSDAFNRTEAGCSYVTSDVYDGMDALSNDEHVNSVTNDKLFSSVMIGRGLLSNPALIREIRGGAPLSASELHLYLNRLYNAYSEYIPEDRNVIFKMLEHWAFLHVHFRDCERQLKSIRKARSKGEYFAAVNNIFSACEFI